MKWRVAMRLAALFYVKRLLLAFEAGALMVLSRWHWSGSGLGEAFLKGIVDKLANLNSGFTFRFHL
ncbi:hypothetical protein GCM10023228_31000 [Brevibacillus fulvus]